MFIANIRTLVANMALTLGLWAAAFGLRTWAWYGSSSYPNIILGAFAIVALLALGWGFRVGYIAYLIFVQRAEVKMRKWRLESHRKQG